MPSIEFILEPNIWAVRMAKLWASESHVTFITGKVFGSLSSLGVGGCSLPSGQPR
jgi:hypothetical protein